MKKVAVIGAGLQARRRVPPIVEDARFEVATIVDIIKDNAQRLASTCGASVETDWKKTVTNPSIDAVLVLTFPDTHAEIATVAMKAGKDVFCEKPLARTSKEGKEMVECATTTGRILKCAFNLRKHPALMDAHRLFSTGEIGKPTFGRGRYGIAGRPGLAEEWRSKPSMSGGGQFMDQGVHLVDLFRWFLGDVQRVMGMVSTTCWPIAPAEDNGFALLQHTDGVTASVHASLTQWINQFEFEIYGSEGFIKVEGLGGGYGTEKLIVGRRDPNGLFSYQTTEYRLGDDSWNLDWQEFAQSIEQGETIGASGVDGLRALEIVEGVYQSSQSGNAVTFMETE